MGQLSVSQAQLSEEDSIKALLISATNVESKIKHTGELWDYYVRYDLDKALELGYQTNRTALDKSEKLYATNLLGLTFREMDMPDSALFYCQNAYRIADEIGDSIYMSKASNNIGTIYFDIDEYELGLEFIENAAEISRQSNDFENASNTYTNLGGIHYQLNNLEKATTFAMIGLELSKQVKDKSVEANACLILGSISFEYGNYDQGKDWILRSIDIYKSLHRLADVGTTYSKLAFCYREADKYKVAEIYYLKALDYADSTKAADAYSRVYLGLATNNKKMGKSDRALDYYILHMDWKDSLSKQTNMKSLLAMQEQFSAEQIQKENELLEKENSIKELTNRENEARLENDKIVIWSSLGSLIVALVFGAFIFNRFKITKKQKGIIEEQKDLVEEAHKEIKDSIDYAKRIQTALLPPPRHVKEYLNDSFILYKPKDVVAGDFYWIEELDGKVLFAAADCTGHGVPGAMVSVICSNALQRCLREYQLADPGQILDKTREIVIEKFDQGDEDVKDGMDIALCSLDGMKLKYAGAHNPLWIIRNGEIIVTRANKEPIGKFHIQSAYQTHDVDLQSGDTIYLFSDGYVDQFGGEKGKKFKSKAFKELLLGIQSESMEKQRDSINTAFENWKGDLEQVDDVCVIGVRV